MNFNKNRLPTSPVVKKAIKLDVTGEQDFKHEARELDPEIAKMASSRLHGTVARATKIEEDSVKTVKPVTAPGAADEEEMISEPTDIRDTTHISPEEAEAIKAVATQADEANKAAALAKEEAIIELKQELGKAEAMREHLEEKFKKFVTIADNLLEKLPDGVVVEFMESNEAEVYREIVEKYKA